MDVWICIKFFFASSESTWSPLLCSCCQSNCKGLIFLELTWQSWEYDLLIYLIILSIYSEISPYKTLTPPPKNASCHAPEGHSLKTKRALSFRLTTTSRDSRNILWRWQKRQHCPPEGDASRQPRRYMRKCSRPCQNEAKSFLRRGESRITRIALGIVWLYIFCHAWKLVPTMYEAMYGYNGWPEWLLHINDISHTFIVFNSAVNFLLYTVL